MRGLFLGRSFAVYCSLSLSKAIYFTGWPMSALNVQAFSETASLAAHRQEWAVLARDAKGGTLVVPPAAWCSLPIHALVIPSQAEWGRYACVEPTVEVALSGTGRRSYQVAGRTRDLSTSPRMVEIFGADFEIERARYAGRAGICLSVRFPQEITTRLLKDDTPPFQLHTQHELFDERVARLLSELATDANAGMPNGPLYSEGISLCLLAVLQQYRPAYRGRECKVGRLSPAHAARIVEYIEGRLGSTLSIELLSSVLEMSPHRFAKQFKATFNQSPHQYVLRRRVDRGWQALRTNRAGNISEVALEFGFSSHAHFTSTCKRLRGETPSMVRSG